MDGVVGGPMFVRTVGRIFAAMVVRNPLLLVGPSGITATGKGLFKYHYVGLVARAQSCVAGSTR